jgi:hypothetical protein
MRRYCTTVFLLWVSSCLFGASLTCFGQGSPAKAASNSAKDDPQAAKPQHSSADQLERDFFQIIRTGDAKQFLAYVPEGGVNIGPKAQHLSRTEVDDQLTQHTGLYCKLFDSSCVQSEIKLDNSGVRACSYRELLTNSSKVRTAATATTRNDVRQAILVAEVKNDNCSGVGLIDFIFNLQADGWKLFSIP